ncbi:MAG: hypothetical protein IJ566_03855 [Cardiobacteriaceae bacterium]|nr:hypothetical protein [Cardiobacteriaceae bacterium]
MKLLYVRFLYLVHQNIKETSYKLLGIFSSMKKLGEVIDSIKNNPDFNQESDDFLIETHPLNESDWNEGFVLDENIPFWAYNKPIFLAETAKKYAERLCNEKHRIDYMTHRNSEYDSLIKYAEKEKIIYVLMHSYEDAEDNEYTKLLGVYSNLELAIKEKERYSKLPGFRNMQENLYIDEFTINDKRWEDGFVTCYYS